MTLFWKSTLIITGLSGLYAAFGGEPGFRTSYLLDMAGPAWNYILIRGQFNSTGKSILPIQIPPAAAFFLIGGICFIIETMQYFKIYDAHFDPFDYLAYVSLLFPLYLIDRWQQVRTV